MTSDLTFQASNGLNPHLETADVLERQEGPKTWRRRPPWRIQPYLPRFHLSTISKVQGACRESKSKGIQNHCLQWIQRTDMDWGSNRLTVSNIFCEDFCLTHSDGFEFWLQLTTPWPFKMRKLGFKPHLSTIKATHRLPIATLICCSNSHWKAHARLTSWDGHVSQPWPSSQQTPDIGIGRSAFDTAGGW